MSSSTARVRSRFNTRSHSGCVWGDAPLQLPDDACVVFSHFFFSSRRRHTRLQGDWSSDVCSSDLDYPVKELIILDDGTDAVEDLIPNNPCIRYICLREKMSVGAKRNLACELANGRSEERRVGKECRSRWSPYH